MNMKLKFRNKEKNMVNLLMVATLEYIEGSNTIVVWDYTRDKVTIECNSVEEAETCVSALWNEGQFELGEVVVFWN